MKFSETFYSPQGEGMYTGVSSLWIRFFMCNLQCDGFGQDQPTQSVTWDLPYQSVDISSIERVEDLPVFSKGCDSSYTWARKYKHLIKDVSAGDAVDELESKLPTGKFKHTKSGMETHLCITGGEPLMKHNQKAIIELLTEMLDRGNYPKFITVESNGTQELTSELADFIKDLRTEHGVEWMWSLSPKLWNVAGEPRKKAIKPECVTQYVAASPKGQLKFVLNHFQESWDELEEVIPLFREAGVPWDIWVMGIGGTLEGLKVTEADIAIEAIKRGYNYTTRAHVHIFGNAIGR
jgi:6-pyruvoyltetrahydropterin 2'-reductase